MQYRLKTPALDAVQWLKNGDHPHDYDGDTVGFENGEPRNFTGAERKEKDWEGSVVRYFRRPGVPGDSICADCGHKMDDHGWIENTNRSKVCPGDWLVMVGPHLTFSVARAKFERDYEPAATFPNPLQVMFGTGRILSSVAHDPDGQYAMLTFEDSGEDHPVGASAKHLPARQPDWRRPGQVILYFGNYASAVAVRQTLNELIDEWKTGEQLPVDAMEKIIRAVDDYHYALDTRQHGGVAADKLVNVVQRALNREWDQGKEKALRESLPIPGPGGDGRTHAPFTEEQIASIVVWQKTDWVHPLTHCDGVPMMVDTNALHCTKCGAKQTWVPGRVLAGPPAKPDILARAERDASAS